MTRFFGDLSTCGGPLEDFDELLWYATADSVTVGNATAVFRFKDGTVIETDI